MNGFKLFATVCFFLSVVMGVISLYFAPEMSPEGLLITRFGALIGIKISFFGLMMRA